MTLEFDKLVEEYEDDKLGVIANELSVLQKEILDGVILIQPDSMTEDVLRRIDRMLRAAGA